MISISTETVLSLHEACRRLPARRAGRPTHPATLHRWATTGINGTKLETLRIGGVVCTSIEALQRFCDRLSETASLRSDSGGAAVNASPPTCASVAAARAAAWFECAKSRSLP